MNYAENIVAFNEEAFKRLYDGNYLILLGQLQKKGINKFDAEDLIQEAFLILWRIRNKTEIKNPDSYIRGIINNLTCRFFKDKEKKKLVSSEDSEIDELFDKEQINIDEEILERIDKENNIENALSELKEEGKMNEGKEAIFNNFYREHKSYFEISKELNVSINEIGVTLFRLRNEIRKKILKKGGFE